MESDGLAEYIQLVAQGKTPHHINKTEFTKQVVRIEDVVDELDFECETYAVKMNAAGDWLVTLKVPYRYRHAVTDMSALAGMNVQVHMKVDGFFEG